MLFDTQTVVTIGRVVRPNGGGCLLREALGWEVRQRVGTTKLFADIPGDSHGAGATGIGKRIGCCCTSRL